MPDVLTYIQHLEVSVLYKVLLIALIVWAALAAIDKFLDVVWAMTHWKIMGLQINEQISEEEDDYYFNKSVLGTIALLVAIELFSLAGIKIFSALGPNQFLGRDLIEMFVTLSQGGAVVTAIFLFALLVVGFNTRLQEPEEIE